MVGRVVEAVGAACGPLVELSAANDSEADAWGAAVAIPRYQWVGKGTPGLSPLSCCRVQNVPKELLHPFCPGCCPRENQQLTLESWINRFYIHYQLNRF